MERIAIIALSVIIGILIFILTRKNKYDGKFIVERRSEDELLTVLQLECEPISLLQKDKLILKIEKK